MEELIRSTGRGHIVAAPVLNGDIDTSRVRTVLANDHHLSFLRYSATKAAGWRPWRHVPATTFLRIRCDG